MYKRVTRSPSRLLLQNSEDVTGKHGHAELQKTDILGTARVLRTIMKYPLISDLLSIKLLCAAPWRGAWVEYMVTK
jgi:hypothetical protein